MRVGVRVPWALRIALAVLGVALGASAVAVRAARAVPVVESRTALIVTDEATLPARSVKVWAGLGHARGIGRLLGIKPSRARTRADKLAAEIPGIRRSGDRREQGRLVTISVATGSALRLVWEPEGGAPLRDIHVTMTKAGDSTRLRVMICVLDHDAPSLAEAESRLRADLAAGMASFRQLIETR